MTARRVRAGEERMGDYLRASAPEQTSALNDDDLRALVVRYRESGARMGLGNERALCIWGFLMASSGDRFEHLPHVRTYLVGGPGDPDEKVETLLETMTRIAATKREVG